MELFAWFNSVSFILGMFVGGSVGIVVSGLLFSGKLEKKVEKATIDLYRRNNEFLKEWIIEKEDD